jgi:hypothetical protein
VEVIEEDSVDGPGAPFAVEDEAEEVHRTVRPQLEETMAHILKNALRMFVFPTKLTRNLVLRELKRVYNVMVGLSICIR